MQTAFQSNAFQNNAFQIDITVSTRVSTEWDTSDPLYYDWWRKRHKKPEPEEVPEPVAEVVELEPPVEAIELEVPRPLRLIAALSGPTRNEIDFARRFVLHDRMMQDDEDEAMMLLLQ